MYTLKRLSKVFESSEEIPFDDSSRIILMSDCHRGDGSWADGFMKNQHIYFAALNHYFNENYTYIELGDGDELWENRSIENIINMHSDVFWKLSEFVRTGRAHFIFGNHDMVKRKYGFIKSGSSSNFDERKRGYIRLLENVTAKEGLILRYKATEDRIFLIHGHQADFLNDKLWRVGRFFSRYLWKPLEMIGVKVPISPAQNFKKEMSVEKRLIEWTVKENHMLIAGHTHRPVLPETNGSLYFNDGSCVHPRCITGIEITEGNIALVKWSVRAKDDGSLFAGREVLAGPKRLKDYFNNLVYEGTTIM